MKKRRRGIVFNRPSRKWFVLLPVCGYLESLGPFTTRAEANAAYDCKEQFVAKCLAQREAAGRALSIAIRAAAAIA